MSIGYLNGEFITLDQPAIPLEERGHQFGDGVYEVIRVYGGRPFLLREHLERLEASAEAVLLELPYSRNEIKAIIAEGLERLAVEEAEIYLQVTRGIAPRNHLFPDTAASFSMTMKEARAIPPELYARGVKVLPLPDERWKNCYIKSLNLLPNILAKQTAVNQGYYEAVLYNEDGVTEGSSTNLFVVKDKAIYTHPSNRHILHGITRQQVLRIAAEHDILVHENYFPLEFLQKADEVFITSSLIEIMPVSHVGEMEISESPGEITKLLQKAFKNYIAKQ